MTVATVRDPDSPKARQIVEGARAAFLELGYEGASTDEIVRRAGVSKGTVYAYFPTKQDLFAAIIREECEHQAKSILGTIDTGKPIDQLLRALAKSFVSRFLGKPFIQDMFRLAMAEAKRFPGLARTFYESGPETGKQRIAALLDDCVARGEIEIDDTRIAAVQFEHLCKAEFFNKVLFGVERSFSEEQIDRFVDRAVTSFLKIYPPVR